MHRQPSPLSAILDRRIQPMHKEAVLRRKIKKALKEQGFTINPHVSVAGSSKLTFKRVQQRARLEQISFHKKFLEKFSSLTKSYFRDGKDIIPEEIELELRAVKSDSFEEILFRWWNFIWWSIPYQRSYGRQMRFLLWDTTHDSPFGLICLQSPVLKMSVRDNLLGIPKNELDLWINRSLAAQRVGALPPYNELLGGKMVALSLTSNEIRAAYREKYKNYISIIKGRKLKPDLLFITTTSAFGKSSLYNRLKYNGERVADCQGYTQGSGTFHIPEELYEEMLETLADQGIDTARGYGHGPSRKLKLISLGFKYLGLRKYEYHGIKREFYLFPLAENLREVIKNKKRPIYYKRPFDDLVTYWKGRWCIPRAQRKPEWKNFKANKFFKKTEKLLRGL